MSAQLKYVNGHLIRTSKGPTVIANCKDIATGNSVLKTWVNPKRPFWITKPHFRNHSYTKEYAYENELDMFVVNESELVPSITRQVNGRSNYNMSIRQACRNQYVYGADIDVRVILKKQMEDQLPEHTVKYTIGYLDIETSVLGGDEIILISYIDGPTRNVYLSVLESFMRNKTEQDIRNAYERKFLELRDKLHSESRENLDSRMFNIRIKIVPDEREVISSIFKVIHQHKPDFTAIWSLGFDIPKILKRLKFLGMDPEDVMCHPDVPPELRRAEFREHRGYVDHITSRWHWPIISGYTQFIDAMALYSRLRVVKGREVQYSLEYLATKNIGSGKIGFDSVDHYTMQNERFVDYAAYNIFDSMLMLLLEEQNEDVQQMMVLSGPSILEKFHQQTHFCRNVFYGFCRDVLKAVPGSIGSGGLTMPEDNRIFNSGGNVLSPLLAPGVGVSLIKGLPYRTKMQMFVMDIDATSMYPSISIAYNMSRETKLATVIDIEGKEKSDVEDYFENMAHPRTNAVYIGSEFFNLPSHQGIIGLWDEFAGTGAVDGVPISLEEKQITSFSEIPELEHENTNRSYAAIVSDDIPSDIVREMQWASYTLNTKGLVMRTCWNEGCLESFMKGNEYAVKDSTVLDPEIPALVDIDKRLQDIASECLASPESDEYTKQMAGTALHRLFGRDLKHPSGFLLCWTPDGAEKVGEVTAQTGSVGIDISTADSKNIPVINAGRNGWKERFRKITGYKPQPRRVKVWNIKNPNCPKEAVMIDRKTPYGNPYKIDKDTTRDQSISKFREYFYDSPGLMERVRRELAGEDLACHCKPEACHGDVYREYLDQQLTE